MHRNEVVLAGRLSMEPAHRELPGGALLTQWRLAVRRPGSRSGRQRSDAIECATIDDGVRAMLAGWQRDDLVEVEGALRRRWWRGGSRYEIEVRTARRVETAAPRIRPCRRTPQADDERAATRNGRAAEVAEAPDLVMPEAASCGDDAGAGIGRAGAAPDAPDTVTPEAGPWGDGPAARVGQAGDGHGVPDAAMSQAAPSGDVSGASPAASSCHHQDDAVSAEFAGEVVSQSRRSA
ncbi:single-stranded DNA-binding protein [Microbispora hainanensis]|uniref:single-stranded DNA-binding protein n=1 Tax=Microbispora TaxID=2005 RepID=UPI00115AECCD|nr:MULTISPECIES: single-stranded DNA-binding protein [Microbispora]NJP29470.1 single-stranded DNA-binding protein [Microbispora sp. CL1-1]TQS05035.1 single-stranded DNA-binding protein [Microbispora sp. SCL1-1]